MCPAASLEWIEITKCKWGKKINTMNPFPKFTEQLVVALIIWFYVSLNAVMIY
jgi:hypothetical protein